MITIDDCLICRRWPSGEDHEDYRRFVTDPEYRYALAPMSFAEWLGLDEAHAGHRDQAAMLDLVLNTDRDLLTGERRWLVPVVRPVLAVAEPSDLPLAGDMPPEFRTSLVERAVEGHHTWVSFTINAFGLTAREDRYVGVHVPYDLAFDAIRLRAATAFADAYAKKQRSER